MIVLLVFFSIFIGLNVRYGLIAYSILAIVYLLFIFIKYKKQTFFLCFLSLGISIGVSFINPSFEQEKYSGIVIEASDNYFVLSSKLEKIYVYEKSHQYEIGDILSIEGTKSALKMTRLESEFDYESYLNKKGIYSQLNANSIEIHFSNPIRLRTYKNNILKNYSDDTASLIKSIFNGGGNSEIKTDMSYLHLARLMSISGIYIYTILNALSHLLAFKLKEKWAKITAIGLLSPYLVFSFPKFSVVRIFTVFIARWINDFLLKKRFSYLTIISLCAIGFLLFDYHNAYQDSFILGFFIPIFAYFINNTFKSHSKLKSKLINIIIIFALILPFEIKYYNSLNLLAYPLQIIFTPLFICYGAFSICVFFKVPMVDTMNGFTNFMKSTVSFFRPVNMSINIPAFPDWIMLLYYGMLFTLLYFYCKKFYPLKNILVLICTCFGFFYTVPIKNMISNEVSFINVGQGDSCLVRAGNSAIMIDTGGSLYKDIANDVLIPYLKAKRLYNIDVLITTHDDYDHSGAKENLCKYFKVKKYVTSYTSFPFTINGITFKNYNIYSQLWTGENEESLVIGFNLSNTNYLIMGDAPINIEKKIIEDNQNLKIDVLKVGHHGSDTSTCDEFVKAIKPKYGIISVGKNYYGHPSKSVLSILNNNSVEVRRTDQDGTISFY